jgi:hypothetical protein
MSDLMSTNPYQSPDERGEGQKMVRNDILKRWIIFFSTTVICAILFAGWAVWDVWGGAQPWRIIADAILCGVLGAMIGAIAGFFLAML